ncbi:hypothetical protein ZWY2020_001646 [Hordeum vulgare]|nr:hypothetical protein ZWY2020_001646 [Hordeum vulgare]
MALAPASLQSFLTGRPLCTAPQVARSSRPASARLSCRASNVDKDGAPPAWAANLEMKNLGKLAMVALAAGVLVLAPVDDAMAGKSGGRIGGKAFRSAAPRPSGPRINNSRTNIYVNPWRRRWSAATGTVATAGTACRRSASTVARASPSGSVVASTRSSYS